MFFSFAGLALRDLDSIRPNPGVRSSVRLVRQIDASEPDLIAWVCNACNMHEGCGFYLSVGLGIF